MKIIGAAVLALFVAGCSVGPDYQRPEVQSPTEWTYRDSSLTIDSTAIAAADTGWWQLFGDTVLTDLIHTALTENTDIRIAAARVEEFMGLYGATKSDYFPKIDAEAGASRGQRPFPGITPTEPRATTNVFTVNLAASWEIDIWGKIRRASEAARADLLASEENRRAVVLTTVALIANAYIDLLSLDKQLDVAHRTVQSREYSVNLFRQRFEKGDVSELELSQVESQYWLAKSQVPLIEADIAFVEHALSVLIGRMPGPIERGTTIDSLMVPGIPEGLPSEILERRPDVRQAEEQLIAANARIGVAKSYYFPSISLTGLFGVGSADLSKLFAANTQIWNVGGGIFQPIFHWGEISGQVAASEAIQRQTLNGYVATVRNAFRDAEDALVDRTKSQDLQIAREKQVQALRIYERLARMRYRDGVTSYLEVLDAERSLFDTELLYAQSQARLYKSVVGVYRAFGGGWVDWASMKSYQPMDPVEERKSE